MKNMKCNECGERIEKIEFVYTERNTGLYNPYTETFEMSEPYKQKIKASLLGVFCENCCRWYSREELYGRTSNCDTDRLKQDIEENLSAIRCKEWEKDNSF